MVIPFPPNQLDEAEKQMVEARQALTQQLAIVNMLIRNLRILRKEQLNPKKSRITKKPTVLS